MTQLRLDYVSPLPPVRSGIADYSVDLLPHLAARCDLRVVQLPGQPVLPELLTRWPVVGAEELGQGGRLPLYQMGNNYYHEAVYELALERPGILTLHDIVLHHFLIDRTLKRKDFAAYHAALGQEHGWIGEAAALPLRWPGGSGDAVQFNLPAHRRLLVRQRGILTHSPWAAEGLHLEFPELRVRAIPMGVPLPAAVAADTGREFKLRHGLPLDRPLLGSFGFQTPMKRTDVVIKALALPALADVHLMVAGEVSPVFKLVETAREAGVVERVHFLGFLPFDEFEAAIAAADLCLNLRYPTAGETSASLLRILAMGRGAVVSDYGQAADLPPDAVVKIPLGEDEAGALAARTRALLSDPQRLQELGRRARDYIRREHDPAHAATAILAACSAWCLTAPVESSASLPTPTSLLHREMSGGLEVLGADLPWPAGERRKLRIRLKNRSQARWLASERNDGGLALEVQVQTSSHHGNDDRWLPLPFDLEPQAEHLFELDLRRPLGPVRLRVVPHVLGHPQLEEFTTFPPVWERDI